MFRGPPLKDVISKAAELKLEGVELEFGSERLTPWDFEKAKKLKEHADSLGLTITGFQPHTFFINSAPGIRAQQKELLNVEACCKMANQIDVPYVRIQIISYTYGPLPDLAPDAISVTSGRRLYTPHFMAQFQQGLAGLLKAIKIAENYGVTLGLDNHFFLTVLDHLKIVKMINSPHLKLFMDTANAHLNGEDITANALAAKDLLIHCHVKDRIVYGSESTGTVFTGESMVPIGMGMIDWKGYVKALEEINYKGFLSIEGNALGFSPEETTKIGRDYLRSLE